MGKSTKSIGHSVLNELALTEILVGQDLEALFGQLSHDSHIFADASVVDEVTEEAKNIQKLLFSEAAK